MPPEKELNELFNQLLQTLGVGPEQKAMMINLDATNKSRLKVSSKLLSLARVIGGNVKEPTN